MNKKEIVFASLAVEYGVRHGFSLLEFQEYLSERVYQIGLDWDDECNQMLDLVDSLYSHLYNSNKFDYSKFPFLN